MAARTPDPKKNIGHGYFIVPRYYAMHFEWRDHAKAWAIDQRRAIEIADRLNAREKNTYLILNSKGVFL